MVICLAAKFDACYVRLTSAKLFDLILKCVFQTIFSIVSVAERILNRKKESSHANSTLGFEQPIDIRC